MRVIHYYFFLLFFFFATGARLGHSPFHWCTGPGLTSPLQLILRRLWVSIEDTINSRVSMQKINYKQFNSSTAILAGEIVEPVSSIMRPFDIIQSFDSLHYGRLITRTIWSLFAWALEHLVNHAVNYQLNARRQLGNYSDLQNSAIS